MMKKEACSSVLLLLVLLQSLATGKLQWSYANYGPHSQQLLSFKNKVNIQTAENISVSSSTCISAVDDERTRHFICLLPTHLTAIHGKWIPSTPLSTLPGILPLSTFISLPQLTLLSWNHTTNSQVFLRVWIHTDQSNEENSLSAQFKSVGESPSLTVITPGLVFTSTSHGFSASCSCWTFTIQADTLPFEMGVEITGKNVIVSDCGVRPTRVLISRSKFTNSAIELSANISVDSSTTHELKLFQDPQVTGVVILVHSGRTFITQDDFRTIENVQVAGTSTPVDEVAMTSNSLLLLSSGSLYTLPAEYNVSPQMQGDGFEHVVSGHTAVAWSQDELHFLLSTDGGLNFRNRVVQLEQPNVDRIHSVVVHPSLPEVEVLVSHSNSTAHFRMFNTDADTWTGKGYNFTYDGGPLNAQFFPSSFGELLVWDNAALYYSPNRGLTVSRVLTYTTSDESSSSGVLLPHQFDPADSIKQVAQGPHGQFAVLSSTNRLFYGTISVGYGIEIQSGESPASNVAIVFNSIGDLKLVSTHTGFLSVRKVPTYPLVLSALYPPPSCPFLQWQHSVNQAVYYLDRREHIEVWASLAPKQWENNLISVLTSDPSLVSLNVSHQLTQTALEGSVLRNTTVFMQPSQSVSDLSTRTAIKISASSQSLACRESAEAVALISVQCPPTRHIRVKRPSSQRTPCPSYDNFSYTIRKNQYDPELRGRAHVPGNADMVVEYNVSRFGCPMKLPYTNTFKPVLELYDGDTFIEEVPVDFVVWELNGRTDFGYSATANRVRCLSAPQNWQTLLENSTHPSMAWTPQIYSSCFTSDGDPLVKSAPYQVLNKTGGSSLVWRGYNGVYLLAAQVVAPEYSYCDLRAYFAVEVYGAVSYSYIGYILLVLTCLVALVALLTAYFCYRNMLRAGIKKLQKTD